MLTVTALPGGEEAHLDVPNVSPVVSGEVPHLGNTERHRANAEIQLIPAQGWEYQVQVSNVPDVIVVLRWEVVVGVVLHVLLIGGVHGDVLDAGDLTVGEVQFVQVKTKAWQYLNHQVTGESLQFHLVTYSR